jgi:hypothetical protein
MRARYSPRPAIDHPHQFGQWIVHANLQFILERALSGQNGLRQEGDVRSLSE